MDETYHSALTVEEVTKPLTKSTGRKSTVPIITTAPTFAFHKKYVQDVSDVIAKEGSQKKQMQLIMQKYFRNRKELVSGWTMQTFPLFKVGYILPPIRKTDEDDDDSKPSLIHDVVRTIVIGAFNNFIYLQEAENAKLQSNR